MRVICPRPLTEECEIEVTWNGRLICTVTAAPEGPAIRIAGVGVPEITHEFPKKGQPAVTLEYPVRAIFQLDGEEKSDA
jgi:hypothetical protein